MADPNPAPQQIQGTSNALGREVRVVSNWGLDLYKDEIVALHIRTGVRIQDLPQLVEHELGIKAKPKAYRIARARWAGKKNVPTEHSMCMIGIRKKWAKNGRSVEFELSGKPYSSARLERFINYQRKTHHRDDTFWDALASYSARDIPAEIKYFDPSDPDTDLMALDRCLEQVGQQQSNSITMGNNHTIMSQGQVSWEIQDLAPNTSFRPLDAPYLSSPGASMTSPSDSFTIKGSNRVNTAELISIWQWVVAPGSFLDYMTEIAIHPCERAMNLYRKHFGNVPYDPFDMDELVEQLLEDDRLHEAEEIAVLAVELSELSLGPNSVESWKAKGNLAYVYHEQGRCLIARQLGENTVEFFKRNGTDFDANALIFKTNLAHTLLMLGEWSEAKRLCYNTIEFSRQKFECEDNIITLTAKVYLAEAYNALKEWHEAREILETVTRARLQEQRFATAKTLQAYIELAKVLQRLGLDSEALNIQCRLEKELVSSGVTRSMWTLELVFSVGEQLYDLGHYVGAEKVFRNLVQCTSARAKSRNHTKVVFANCWVASSLYQQRREKEATTIYLECIGVLKEVLGPYNRHTLTCMYNLALSQETSLTLVDFEAKIVEVRDLRRLYLGENDSHTLHSQRDCAEFLWTKGKWNDALDLLRGLRARLKGLPKSRRLYYEWKLMKWEAKFFSARGDYKEAMNFQQKRLDLGEKIFGKKHPLVLGELHSLATSYSTMGEYDKAEKLLSDGISTLSAVLDGHHPAVTKLKAHYAAELAHQGKLASAAMLQRQILQEYIIHGEQHPYFIDARRYLAGYCARLGQFSEAETLFKQAIQASKTTFGSTHRETNRLLSGYAKLMKAQGNLGAARDLYEKAWNMTRTSLGRLYNGNDEEHSPSLEHPDTLTALESFVNVLDDTGDSFKCLPFRRQILSGRTQLLGHLHPNTISAISNLAYTLSKIGETREAVDLYRDSLEKSCTTWGKWHPRSLTEKGKLIGLLYKLKLFTEFRVHYKELLGITKDTKGGVSIQTAVAFRRIGILHFDQGQYIEAKEHFQHSLRILESIEILSRDCLCQTVYVMIDLARCYSQNDELKRAEVQIEAAIKKIQGFLEHDDPIFSYANAHLAWTYFYLDRFEEAKNLAQSLLQKPGQDANDYPHLRVEELFARSMTELRGFQGAIIFLVRAISKRRNKNPKDPIALRLEDILQKTIAKRDA